MDYAVLDSILASYQSGGYFPSAVLEVFDGDKTLYRTTVGAVNFDTWFDLASVSKLICTTLILSLMDEGYLTPEDGVLQHLPVEEMGEVTRQRLSMVTVQQLMTHTSGIVPWFPFYSDGRGFYTILEHVLSTTEVEPKMAYSDLNFMLLGKMFCHLSGMTLPEGLEHYIKKPMGITDMAYGAIDHENCAPSCYGNQIEQRMCGERGLTFDGWRPNGVAVQGQCNDGNAYYYFNGISGHAGVFATANALAKLGQYYLNVEKPIFKRAMNEMVSERGLGFDKTDVFPEGCGHTGFTGTSLWVSPTHNIGAVILTNKFYRMEGEPPGSSHEFRRDIHNALL